jgi:transposase
MILSKEQRGRITGLVQAGWSIRAAACDVGCSPTTAAKWVNRKRQTGDVNNLPRPGRPCVTSARQDASILNHALNNRSYTGGSFT